LKLLPRPLEAVVLMSKLARWQCRKMRVVLDVWRCDDERQRRIPIHPELRPILDAVPRQFDRIFTAQPSPKFPEGGAPVNERRCLVALKPLCKRCGFSTPNQYKLHTLRHTFASMCARNNISYKYALEWMGHRSSDILDLYYTMFDPDAHAAMKTLVYSQPSKPGENTPISKPAKKSRKGKKDSA
jgi:integrase